MPTIQPGENHPETAISLDKAVAVFLALLVVVANVLLVLFVLGFFTLWEAGLVLITVLILAGGTIWSVVSISRKRPQLQAAEPAPVPDSGD